MHTTELVSYIAGALERPIPEEVRIAASHHVLDTLAACVSGRDLPAGRAGASYAVEQGIAGDARIIATDHRTSVGLAAFANAMAAHADESDDTHELSKSHPGCSIIPTALAVAESLHSTGEEFLRAVALGYDIGCRVNLALWPSLVEIREQRWGTPGISGMFGSASALAALKGFSQSQVRHLLSYVAQQVSGMNTWKRDVDHIEKAYVLGGWPSHGAIFASSLVEAGWSGVDDVFFGDPNFLDIVGKEPDPSRLVDQLGQRFEIQRTHIKLHPVGSPAQAPVQALLEIILANSLADDQIEHVRVTIPSVLAHTVQRSREMSNINLYYLLSTVVEDGKFSFDAAHDESRFALWRNSGEDPRIAIVADDSWEPRRQALVEVQTRAGDRLEALVDPVRGSPEKPLAESEVTNKAFALMAPTIGAERAEQVSAKVLRLWETRDLNELTELLTLS